MEFKTRIPRATDSQIKYLECLFIDCGFSTRFKRNDYLTSELGRPIKFLDELNIKEASKIIDILRELKDEQLGTR